MRTPTLTRADSWLLAAVLRASRGIGSVALSDVVAEADWLMVGEPSFDELSFGLARLAGAGLIEIDVGDDHVSVRSTEAAARLVAVVTDEAPSDGVVPSRGDVLEAIAAAVGAPPDGAKQDEDRSLGRVSGFKLRHYADALREYDTSLRN